MNFKDLLEAKSARMIALSTVGVGNVYVVEMDKSNGIVPKDGWKSRRKYFIVLGFDGESVYGGVVINSHINFNIQGQIFAQHYPLLKSRYDFLDYDSWVDCMRLITVSVETFKEWKFVCILEDDDTEKIKALIVGSPREAKQRLMRFGLIEPCSGASTGRR